MRASKFHRWIALAALLAAWTGLTFAPLAHADGHAHRFCAEHGTIEEGTADAGSHDGAASQSDAFRALPTADDAHTACPLATLPGRDALVVTAAPVTPSTVEIRPAHACAPAEAHCPLSPLVVAPKVSPPAA